MRYVVEMHWEMKLDDVFWNEVLLKKKKDIIVILSVRN